MSLPEDGGTFTGHHIGRRPTHCAGQNAEEYGRISWRSVLNAFLYPDVDEQPDRHAPYEYIGSMSLHEPMGKEPPDYCRQKDRRDVIPVLDRGSLQPEQHITNHAPDDSGDDSSGEHRQEW